MSSLKYSDLESRRFNKQIYRGSLETFDIAVLKDFYQAYDPEILILRLPVSEQYKLHALNELGKHIINADTLVYYEANLTTVAYNPIRNGDIQFVTATAAHLPVFERLVPAIFSDYTNHYFSNPLLNKQQITEGYTEWALSNIGSLGHLQVIAYNNTEPIGFITCSYDAQQAEIILNGVLPEYQQKGIYTDLLRHVKDHFRQINLSSIKVSTQIQNFAVQKAWNREGFVLNAAFITLHLNKI